MLRVAGTAFIPTGGYFRNRSDRLAGNRETGECRRFSVGRAVAFTDGMVQDDARIDALRGTILGCAIEVHRRMGPGLLESVYKTCLIIELRREGLLVETNRKILLSYRGQPIEEHLFIDILVEDLIVLEVKSVTALAPVHKAQVITYLKLANRPAGLLLNFNTVLLKDGIRRIVHPDLYEKPSAPTSSSTAEH